MITGAGRGIGRALAIAFSNEGAKVSLAARSTDELQGLAQEINSGGGTAIASSMDLQDENSIKSAIKKAVDEHGPVDVLINNAAIFRLSPISEMPTEMWDDVMNTNMRGLFIACREVLPAMMERKSGRIINIGSLAGRRGYEEQGVYCASKHALIGFSKVLALETQDYNIRVHVLSPGGVLTELSEPLRKSRGVSEDDPDWMTSEEVAKAAIYLCSQEQAAFTDELVLRRFASEPWR